MIGKGECSFIEAIFCNYLGLQKMDFSNILPKKVWIRALALRPPMAKSKTSPRPLRETLRVRMVGYPAEIAEGAED